MKVKIKVIYNLHDQEGIPPLIEEVIKLRMEEIGAEFYASGLNNRTGERELCFDWELEKK